MLLVITALALTLSGRVETPSARADSSPGKLGLSPGLGRMLMVAVGGSLGPSFVVCHRNVAAKSPGLLAASVDRPFKVIV